MIRGEGVTFGFKGRILMQDMNFHALRGERVVFTGPSGSGKSSLLKVLQGFLPVQSGRIFLESTPLTPDTVSDLRLSMAWLPQASLTGISRVGEALLFPFQFRYNRSLTPSLPEIHSTMDRLLLPPSLLDRSLTEVSGGERQRLGILLCLLLKRPLLLLDEPTSSLDRESKRAVTDLLMGKETLTLVSTSHDPDWIRENQREIRIA